MTINREDELKQVLDRWCRAIAARDVNVAADLYGERYSLVLPNGDQLTRQEELALVASPDLSTDVQVERVRLRWGGKRATAVLKSRVERRSGDTVARNEHTSRLELRHDGERWRLTKTRVLPDRSRPSATAERQSIVERLGRRLATMNRTSFQEVAYLPYMPGKDFALPKTAVRGGYTPDRELPIPPRRLWLGYNYPTHGKMHVDAMFAILSASDFALRPGDRVLDFGCGAGRMIRHLRSQAETSEVWGTDISAEHILWCKRNLSPPFRFATTTKVPHLPFEDRSFRLIYCGSVFTHIDDLADAWLLELRRILTPDGRLYVTIHDNDTVRLMDSDAAEWLHRVRARKLFRKSKDSFDMISIGRDDLSQVFYDREYFSHMARSAFEVLSVTPEAYFYQTAYLLKRSAG
jgi:ubiquinone/menaquinone biosynthesis C-methylase UbiE